MILALKLGKMKIYKLLIILTVTFLTTIGPYLYGSFFHSLGVKHLSQRGDNVISVWFDGYLFMFVTMIAIAVLLFFISFLYKLYIWTTK